MPIFLALALPLALTLALGCGGSPPPSGKDLVVSGGKGQEEKAVDPQGKEAAPAAHAENTADFDRFAFSCCKDPAATSLVQAYTDLAEKLAADDEAGSQAAVAALHDAAVAAAGTEGLDDASRQAAGTIATGVEPLKGQSLAQLREPFASLSVAVIGLARAQEGGETRLVSAFCPMAPGHWLQRGQAIRNPYYGSQMLTCGTLEAVTDVE